MACSDEKGSVPDTTASAGEGEDFPIPPSVVAAAAAAELGFPASGNKVLLRRHCPVCLMCSYLQHAKVHRLCLSIVPSASEHTAPPSWRPCLLIPCMRPAEGRL